VQLGKAVATGGASIINTGIGWHEARVPTIATSVPRAAFAWVTQKMKAEFAAAGITTPLITSNRINTPEVAEQVLADGLCRHGVHGPAAAGRQPTLCKKAAAGQADQINTCIACNQACLDHIFKNRLTSCLVNPRACHETELVYRPVASRCFSRRRIAVVGAGPAGLTAATVLAERGHEVQLFDAASEIGGQLNMAKVVPGKEEFHEMLRYLRRRVELTGVHLHWVPRVQAADLQGL
jgi:2,4-dienoyl-CoA reductase (NADPH2)